MLGGDFRVLSRLREGGMGSIWVAEQLSVGRRRAVKIMRAEIAHDARLRERFVLEAKIGATIDSDHVVEVVAAGIDETLDVPWLAMELLDGKDLGAVLAERGGLPPEEVIEIAEPLCHALAAAHSAGVIHRDLKPENVFLARSRRSGGASIDVKVLDFGIAKLAADALSSGGGSGLLGTPLAMAPEQAEATGSATPAIDVWALGLLVYRMLTGRHFWRSAKGEQLSVTAILREILLEPIPLASTRAAEDGVGSTIPPGFDPWFARCLERDPAQRFSEAGAAFTALAAVLRPSAGAPTTQVFSRTPASISPRAHTVALPSSAAAAEAVTVTPVHEDSSFKLGRVDDVAVIRWFSSPTIVSVPVMERALSRAIRDLAGRPCFVMVVVDSSVPAPNAEARDALARSIERHDSTISGVAYVVFGEGFQSAMLRGVITSLMLLSRPSHTTKVFGSIPEAVAWVEGRRQTPSTESSADIAAGIARFCST